MILLFLAQHLTAALHQGTFALALLQGPPPKTCGNLTADFTGLETLITDVRQAVFYLGAIAFVVSVAVAGIMRMTSASNERRIAMSNMALTAAVVGLVIMLLAIGLQNFLITSVGCPS